ncbi:MAG: ROK family protein [Candidatus Omnitrophica bacterium]|nr:ROK family protein [Candidatus Omnitrophota bacterium]
MNKFLAGVDVGATQTKVAILDLKGHILLKDNFSTQMHRKNALIDAVSDLLDSLSRRLRLKKRDFLGLGIGVPGLLDFKRGLVFYFINIPAWKNVPLKKLLEKKTGLPTFVDNDVKVMARGEVTYGAGRGYDNVICLTLGTGVGGAVIIDGKMRRGQDLVAGEIGHVPINEKGPRCNCGGIGCIEAYVGREYFLKEVKKDIRRGVRTSVLAISNNRIADITPEMLTKAALGGDRYALNKWREMGEHLGVALTGVVNLLNPELIIIGGGIAGAGDLVFRPLRETLKKRAMAIQGRTAKVVRAKLGNDAGVIGAAELVKINLLKKIS